MGEVFAKGYIQNFTHGVAIEIHGLVPGKPYRKKAWYCRIKQDPAYSKSDKMI